MAMVINSNIASLNAQLNLSQTQNAVQTALQRLSSGMRINSAKDDAAGLAISQRMSAQILSLNQGIRNANDGISMIQTADGALSQVQTMMQRMRELATQASSDTISDTDRASINKELVQLKQEVDNTASRTSFNGIQLLDGSSGFSGTASTVDTANSTLLVGGALFTAASAGVTAISLGNIGTATINFSDDGSGVVTADNGTVSQQIDLADLLTTGNGYAVANTLSAGESVTLNFDKLGVSVTVAATADTTNANLGKGFGDSGNAGAGALELDTTAGSGTGTATIQIGASANSYDQISVGFSDARITGNSDTDMAALATALSDFNGGTTAAHAQALLTAVDGALDAISGQRATYGAAQNRLTNAVASLGVTSQNLSAAHSQVTDADFAAETAALTRSQILQQAGTAMLAQANSAPQQVLALLKNF